LEQILKLEQIWNIGTNFEKWNKLQIEKKNRNWKKIENGTTFKIKQFKKWNKLKIGTNFKFENFRI
jgi:hypothetical protein